LHAQCGEYFMVESDLHLALKDAVKRHHAGGSRCWYESHMLPWGNQGSLRVDVSYRRNKRSYYTECETKPNLSRLVEKGRRRREHYRRTVYNLVVPKSEYNKHDWTRLRGYFDQVFAYDIEKDEFTDAVDLRLLGPLRDAVLDITMPIYWSKEFQSTYRRVKYSENRVYWAVRVILQCSACRLGLPHPWGFCPKDDCPDSRYGVY